MNDQNQGTPVVRDLLKLNEHDWTVWAEGYQTGVGDGIERGRSMADDDDAARLHQTAYDVVQAAARHDPFYVTQAKAQAHQVIRAAELRAETIQREAQRIADDLVQRASLRLARSNHQPRFKSVRSG